MTLVVARKFGARMLTASDTQISDAQAGRADVIPGQLKTIVIGRYATASYAGVFPHGLEAIREAKKASDRTGSVDQAVRVLIDRSKDGNNDFLIAAHEGNKCSLFKIARGRIAQDNDQHWIGDPAPLAFFSQKEREARTLIDAHGRIPPIAQLRSMLSIVDGSRCLRNVVCT